MATDSKTPAKTLAPLKTKKPTKNKKPTVAFKNLLAQTFPRYWPQLSPAHADELFTLLEKAKSTNPTWFSTKKSTENRPIHYGLQSSTTNIQSGQVKLFILSADLKPRYIINQMILKAIASNDGIKILLVSGLNSRIEQIVNFSCFAFVILDAGWQQLLELQEWCTDIVRSHYPMPEKILLYYEQRRSVPASIGETDIDSNTPKAVPLRSTDETIIADRYHLTKNSVERSFIPPNAANLKPVSFKVQTIKKMKTEFISLNLQDGDSDFHPKKKKKHQTEKNRITPLYHPLVIHKIKNSSDDKASKSSKKKKKSKL